VSSEERQIKIGCCGLRMQKAEYASLLPAVEVQQTFYQPPKPDTLRRWREEVPDDFEFTIKAWQLITHQSRSPTYKRLKTKLSEEELEQCGSFRSTPIVKKAWELMLECADALRSRCMLFQCPASFTPTAENLSNMRTFFSSIERGGLNFLWEPRGDWPADTIRMLCGELNLVHVVDPFSARTLTPEFCYFRLHGRRGWRYVYTDDELEELLEMLQPAKSAYVMFNNVKMVQDALRFQELVRGKMSDA
jgi:uncharacterized protein YecE (DUF72 family)